MAEGLLRLRLWCDGQSSTVDQGATPRDLKQGRVAIVRALVPVNGWRSLATSLPTYDVQTA